MTPVALRTDRLVLDALSESDIDRIAEYCRDPLFEHVMTTPWPYERRHAEGFVRELVPNGWESGTEATWAIRLETGGELIGVIGLRLQRHDVGYWLGGPFRGHGYMSEAVRGVADWALAGGVAGIESVGWECLAGNLASAGTARRAGFRFTQTAPASIDYRDGSRPESWHGVLSPTDDADAARASWPEETRA